LIVEIREEKIMRMLKVYGLGWALIAAIVGVLYQTDSLTSEAILVLGFAASVLTGSGLLVVYPVLLHEDIGQPR
jgi:hypothetical protein